MSRAARMRMYEAEHLKQIQLRAANELIHVHQHAPQSRSVIQSQKRNRFTGVRNKSLALPLMEWSETLHTGMVMQSAVAAYEREEQRWVSKILGVKIAPKATFAQCEAMVKKKETSLDLHMDKLQNLEKALPKKPSEPELAGVHDRFVQSCGFEVLRQARQTETMARSSAKYTWAQHSVKETKRLAALAKRKKQPTAEADALKITLADAERKVRAAKGSIASFSRHPSLRSHVPALKAKLAKIQKTASETRTLLDLISPTFAPHALARLQVLTRAISKIKARVALVEEIMKGMRKYFAQRAELDAFFPTRKRKTRSPHAANDEDEDEDESSSESSSESDDDGIVHGLLCRASLHSGIATPWSSNLTETHPPPPPPPPPSTYRWRDEMW